MNRHRLVTMARALAWEECRVAGSIATVWALAMGLVISAVRWELGPGQWRNQDEFLVVLIAAAPLVLALALALHTANSGHLVGGFARRPLQFPVPVWIAVAVALGTRTLLMTGAVGGVLLLSQFYFDPAPPLVIVTATVAFYVGFQLLDWARAVVPGIVDGVLLALMAVAFFVVFTASSPGDLVDSAATFGTARTLLLVVVALLAAYAAAVPLVHATRTGRTYRIPWPTRQERTAAAGEGSDLVDSRHPFPSPIAAQCWYEWRRYWWSLPVAACSLAAVVSLALWLLAPDVEPLAIAVFILYGTALLVAAAYGIAAGFSNANHRPRGTGYPLRLPMGSEARAYAKCAVALAALTPVIFLVALLQAISWFPAIGGLEAVSFALSAGVVSFRELSWGFLGRLFALSLLAWAAISISTRVTRWVVAVAILGWAYRYIPIFAVGTDWLHHPVMVAGTDADTILIILLVAGAYAFATVRGLISWRSCAGWFTAWAFAAWALFGNNPVSGDSSTLLMESLVLAALVPLPFVAFAIDAAIATSGNTATRRPPSERPLFHDRRTRAAALGVSIAFAAGAVWLGWPAPPAYRAYLQAEGLPAYLHELNDFYPGSPEAKDAANRLVTIAERDRSRESAFMGGLPPTEPDALPLRAYDLYGMGGLRITEPLDPERVAFTDAYWDAVTRESVAAVRAMADQGPKRFRFPINLEDTFSADLRHLAGVRQLSRQLSVDTFQASRAGDRARVLANLRALEMLSTSLADEPVPVSQLTRVAIIGIHLGAVEIAMAFLELQDTDLVGIGESLDRLLPPVDAVRVLDAALHFERAVTLVGLEAHWEQLLRLSTMAVPESVLVSVSSAPLTGTALFRLVHNPAFDRLLLAHTLVGVVNEAERAAQAPVPPARFWESIQREPPPMHLAPMAQLITPAVGNMYQADWRVRMQIQIAQTAIAAERYRRIHGAWPSDLAALVPDLIEAIPYDVLARESGLRVRHAERPDGSFTVYSVGMSGTDHGGRNARGEGDDLLFELIARDLP